MTDMLLIRIVVGKYIYSRDINWLHVIVLE